ncbi:MAG: anhydro-N-acetylmuramic acid kinase [Bdellovibrionales bacterium]|nr:anhydro-N-acetylmuramic acid kinase [Bdellovibrionales bacterium]
MSNTVGIMSGTSLDGVDYVLVSGGNRENSMSFLDKKSVVFPKKLRSSLLKAATGKLNSWQLAELDFELGKFYSSSLTKIAKKNSWKFDLVGLHGQTIYHRGRHCTYQIGEPAYLAHDHKVPVVSDFRPMDIANGGEGAPLATLFHVDVLAKLSDKKPFAFQNLGGIGNITFVGKSKTMSFDTGPANMLLDQGITKASKGKKKLDSDGDFASRGIPEIRLVKKWLQAPVFKKKPPKSLGRENFGKSFFEKCWKDMAKLSAHDKLATLTELTAMSIAKAGIDFLPELPKFMVLGGGGAKNHYLVSRIRYHLPHCEIVTSQSLNWPTDSIEGAAFALMAIRRMEERTNVIPETTGAKRASSLGRVLIP